ncbi:hypothetical protein NXS19_010257 [Fusarium pseudograminearum]|nr:hypothetical protein NXS19_010257 [Fusarium pseudograminearum]
MPSHAAIASQKAHYDGVNPYTSEPVNQSPAGPASFNQQQQYEPQYEQQHPIQLSEYVDQSHNQTYLPVMIPQGKEERNDNLANNEQLRYGDQSNNYAMEPREDQYGRDAMSGNVHQASSYPQASYEPQPSYDQQPNYDHTNGNANGGSKINNYTLTTVGEGFPRLDGGATHGAQPSTRQAESVYTDRDSVLLQTDDEDETPMTRPSVNNRTESHNTISNLHIPGGYPKSSYAA